MLKVKIIERETAARLERDANDFLATIRPHNLLSVKYSIANGWSGVCIVHKEPTFDMDRDDD